MTDRTTEAMTHAAALRRLLLRSGCEVAITPDELVIWGAIQQLERQPHEPAAQHPDTARLDWLAWHWYDNKIGCDPDGWFVVDKYLAVAARHTGLRAAIDMRRSSPETKPEALPHVGPLVTPWGCRYMAIGFCNKCGRDHDQPLNGSASDG